MGKVKEFDPQAIKYLLDFKHNHYWVDYDEKSDTLYISFRKPQCADDSVMEGDFIYHRASKEVVGVTILNAKDKIIEG